MAPGSSGALRGFSLLEVLIALVIFSIGGLSSVALQLVSKRNHQEAAQLSVAAALAQDLLRRMRVNNGAAALRAYVEAVGVPVDGVPPEPTPRCRAAEPCDGLQLALHDVWNWRRALAGWNESSGLGEDRAAAGGLAQPAACIVPPENGAGASGFYALRLVWRGGGNFAGAAEAACDAGGSSARDASWRSLQVRAFLVAH